MARNLTDPDKVFQADDWPHTRLRLQERSSAADLAALYALLLFGMRDYIAKHQDCTSILKNTNTWDAAALYHSLARAGVFDDPLAFNRFSLAVERAIWQGPCATEVDSILFQVEHLLTKLGVLSIQ